MSIILAESIGPPAAPALQKTYLPQLDAMRFFAFLSVFCFHGLPSVSIEAHAGAGRWLAIFESGVLQAGRYGVGLFFLLSSYLITKLLLEEKKITGRIHLRQFYLRRTLRIWPLYYLIVCIGLAIQPLSAEFHLSAGRIASYVFFYSNWMVAAHGWNWNPIYPLWTVSSEEQFYLLWPLLLKFLPTRAVWIGSLVLLVAIPALAFGLPADLLTSREFVYLFLYFSLGTVLAIRDSSTKRRSSLLSLRSVMLLAVAGLLLWELSGITVALYEQSATASFLALVLQVAGTTALFHAFLLSPADVWSKPVVYLGKITYGLYVYHLLALTLVRSLASTAGLGLRTGANHTATNFMLILGVQLPLALGLTVLCASLSYRFFESPFLKLKRRFEFIHSRSI